jgi:benzoylformate decarboxylase
VNKITGRAAFLTLLASEGVRYMFGNPGTTELPIMEAMGRQSDITYVLGLQEAIVVAMADGYARASGKLAACNVHVAPGLGNAMGALYNAKFFGSPVLITAGQQEQGHGLMEPLLYDPLVPIAQPHAKWAIEVTRLQDLPRIVRRAAKIATTPPMGPAFISLPGDILDDEDTLDLGKPTRVDTANRPADATLARLAERLLAANNPVVIAGHELATREAWSEAAQLAELLGAPVYQQSGAYTAMFPTEHPAFMGALARVQREVRTILAPYDLVISLGSDMLRMSVMSPVDPLPEGTPVVQINERANEIGKNFPAELGINADVKETLAALIPVVRTKRSNERAMQADRRIAALRDKNWSAKRVHFAREAEAAASRRPIEPASLLLRITDALPADALLVEEALTTTFPLNNFLHFRNTKSFFGNASGGIGFAMGSVIGMHLALPDRPAVAIIGDGSAMYSIQALWTAAHMKLPITYVIANNRSYRILKERMVAFRGTERFIGMDLRDPEIDFVALARSMGVTAHHIEALDDVVPALQSSMRANGPTLLDVRVADGYGG